MNENLRTVVAYLAEQYTKGNHYGLADKFSEACYLISEDMGITYSEGCGVFYRTLSENHGIQISN